MICKLSRVACVARFQIPVYLRGSGAETNITSNFLKLNPLVSFYPSNQCLATRVECRDSSNVKLLPLSAIPFAYSFWGDLISSLNDLRFK